MKRLLKAVIPLFLAIGILASIGWYLLVYDREFTRDFLISQARHLDASGHVEIAAKIYNLAYDYTGQDDDLAIELANQYKADGNYTKAEFTLTNAIADAPSVDLYTALCKVFIEQDKLLDAIAMLDNISDPALKMEMDRLRPAAPETTIMPGFHDQYITLDFTPAPGKLLCTLDGDYPSVRKDVFSETVDLSSGETVIHAVRIGENGLVSPMSIVSFTIGGVIEQAAFTDPVMEQTLREMLNIDPEDPVMTDRLWEVLEFSVPEEAKSLTDLSYLPYLEKLTIQNRRLESLDVIAGLKYLKELDLSGCRIPSAELAVVSNLPQLEKLNLSNCGLSTIAHLASAKNLTYLDLSSNTLRNLEPLAEMEYLQELYLQHNAVTGLDILQSLLNLTRLDISYNSVTTLSPLSSCFRLTWINAGNNQVEQVDGLDALSDLTHLYLNHNKLDNFDMHVLAKITSLNVLNLSDNGIGDMDPLATLVNLVEMYCANNELVHLPRWPEDIPLSILDISHNQIGTLNPLSKMEDLTYVYCDYNWLKTLDPIANCYRLVMVSAFGNEIKDVSKLTEHNIIVNYDPT